MTLIRLLIICGAICHLISFQFVMLSLFKRVSLAQHSLMVLFRYVDNDGNDDGNDDGDDDVKNYDEHDDDVGDNKTGVHKGRCLDVPQAHPSSHTSKLATSDYIIFFML